MDIPAQLLDEVRQQSEQSDPPVKAAALLHFARVLAKVDPDEALRTLERGIALAKEIPEPEGTPLLRQAAYLAAAVSPPHALRLMPAVSGEYSHCAEFALYNMVDHGHLADAVSYLTDPPANQRYPYGAAQQAFGRSRGDEETQRKILRGAIHAWRGASTGYWPHGFEHLFVHCWKVLPAPEATEVVRAIVERIITEPDGKISARFSSPGKAVKFSSTRESRLFQIFGALRQLDPELADSLCRTHKQLAKAAEVYPRGHHEDFEALSAERREQKPAARCEQPDLMTVDGRWRLLPMPEALRTNFKEPFDAALRLYACDTDQANPNGAPRECWPSTDEFRNILYKAGQHQGRGAAVHLDRIPDPDLRLLAQIELLAAMAGLPQLSGLRIPPRSTATGRLSGLAGFLLRGRIHGRVGW